jgi:signal transduction histidine kinase/ActR/RegA family two-component response regulator
MATRFLTRMDRCIPPELHADPGVRLRARLLVAYTLLVLLAPTVFVWVYIVDHRPDVALTMALACAAGAICLPVLWWTRSVKRAGNVATAAYAITNLVALLQMGGRDQGSYYWLAATPVLGLFLAGHTAGVIWLAAVIIETLAMTVAVERGWLASTGTLPSALNHAMGVMSMAALMFALALVYERAKNDTVAQLQRTAEELRRARESAEAATQARTAFLAHMSHEIRTPMNGVVGMADVLLAQPLSDEQKEPVTVIRESGAALVANDDILDFAKADAGKIALERRAVDLRALIGGVVALFRQQASEAGLALDVEVDPDIPQHLWGDPGRIRQVLVNLVGNAIKFTSRGSVTLRARWRANEVQRLLVQVQDTGIGISERAQERLFQAFSQVDASITRRYGGTGLGLVICRQLLEAMGGTIRVESQHGEGSVFTCELPLIPAPDGEPLPAPAAQRPEAPSRPMHILVVEDNPINRKVIRRLVERLGHHTDEVENGAQAVEAMSHQIYDLVLMDCQMPVMDGFSATEAIRSLQGPAAATPIVALTASALAEDRERCAAVGMDAYLSKPVNAQALAATMERHARRDLASI